MSRLVRAVAVATLAFSSATAVQAQALPSAAEVISKYVTALGGKDAIMKIKSIRQVQTMEIPAMGMTAQMETMQAAPNLTSSKMTIPGMGEILSGYTGTVAWEVSPMSGPRVLADKELDQARDNADMYGSMLFPADMFSSMQVVEKTDFNGEPAYKVKMVRKSNNRETIQYFSVASGLLIGGEATQESQMGTLQVVTKISGYRAVEGVQMFTKMEQTFGPNTVLINVKETTVNTVPATAFEAPAAVKPLIKN